MKMNQLFGGWLFLIGTAALLAGCSNDKVEQTEEKQTASKVTTESSTEMVEDSTAETEISMTVDQGLYELYQSNYPIGIALPNTVFQNIVMFEDVIVKNFNSITCENEMKPDFVLDQTVSMNNLEKTYLRAAVSFQNCQPAIDFALEHNMKIRLHTLVWHSQTPAWFFTEDYTKDGTLVSRDVMLARMENYIADVLGYFNENYPGLIYAVDVVNEAFDIGNGDENGVRNVNNRWYETVGDDYYYQAFVFARKYASEDMKLFYNDYGCVDKVNLILGHLQKAKDEGLIDGIGMQSHLSVNDNIYIKFVNAAKAFCDAGYEVQSTELDIGVTENTDSAFMTQGRKYRSFFKSMKNLQEEGYAITGITVWGLNDTLSWRTGEYALLFDQEMNPKKAYLGAMMDPSIPDVE
ncbi:MAG TPA: endo-1,4-beta-xylanase [Lachnospiraceae bacterium]|nr:endo-1,4-beta-xylanase [Lachnospiraceae bacterium]